MLAIADLHAGYGAIRALHGVSLTVPAGQIVALLGSNGAGKTTLMHTVAGLMRSTGGSVSLDSEPISGLPAHRIFAKGLALVPQGRQLFPEMTVRENIELGGLALAEAAEVGRRVEAILDRFPRLRERVGQRAGGLSGGEQQMLATGRALMSKPRLLLLDEPTTGLAPLIVGELTDILRELKAAGQTIFLVEQNIRMALAVADYVYMIRAGTIVHEGTADALRGSDDVYTSYFS